MPPGRPKEYGEAHRAFAEGAAGCGQKMQFNPKMSKAQKRKMKKAPKGGY